MDLEGSSCCGVDCVTELKNLAHLDRIVESSSSSVVAIAFYSRVCSAHMCDAPHTGLVCVCLAKLDWNAAGIQVVWSIACFKSELCPCSLVGSARRC